MVTRYCEILDADTGPKNDLVYHLNKKQPACDVPLTQALNYRDRRLTSARKESCKVASAHIL